MTLPSSTYRIQFRDGMTFDHVLKIIPYLGRLGISHLYASPIFTATDGSTHGYDVTNANEIDPAIGGRAGFDRMSAALRAAGIGLLVDIVPNHMAASLENPWWRSVVEWGEASPYGRHFDIDWSRKLTLPILGKSLDEALKDGELKLAVDAKAGALAIAYYEQLIPLNPGSYAEILAGLDVLGIAELVATASLAQPDHEAEFHGQMQALLSAGAAHLTAALDRKFREAASIQTVLDKQPWRLLFWKDAPRELSYRRFFEVTGLVGLRVEDPAVFDDAHRLTLELVRNGAIDGLRLDHIDGLADPAGYLNRLRDAVGDETYIVVEKILAEDETLPKAWPISGTTGYEFITALPNVLVETSGMAKITATYRGIAEGEPEFAEGALAVKAMLARKNFAVETNNLLKLLVSTAPAAGGTPDEAAIEAALVSLLVACPVYRTYGTEGRLDSVDAAMWQKIVATAGQSEEVPDKAALSFIDRVFQGDVAPDSADAAQEFRRRFQQLTGPLTAKSIEDTMFYRYNRLIGLNEVGGEPAADTFGVHQFHHEMSKRVATQPAGLSATSTHDTKRGEDGRARLYALSEAPDAWKDAVTRWQEMNAAHVAQL
ncbi:MAG: malto-oligosyltrehalose synthase, partial [Rhizobium sp.]